MKPEILLVGVFVIALLTSYADAKGGRGGSHKGSGSGKSSKPSGTRSNPAPIGWNSPAISNPAPIGWKPHVKPDPVGWNSPAISNSAPIGWKPHVKPDPVGWNSPATSNSAPIGWKPHVKPDPVGWNSPATSNSAPIGWKPHVKPDPVGWNSPAISNPAGGYNSHQSHGRNHGSPPPYTPYNPYAGHSSSPGAGYNPPVGHTSTTIFVHSPGQSHSEPGFGQIAKEAFVHATVKAGVDAAVNRILPGGISGHRNDYHPSNSGAPSNGVAPTEITYNDRHDYPRAMPAEQRNPQAPAGRAAVPVESGVSVNSSVPLKPADPTNSDIPGVIPLEVYYGLEEANFPSPLGYFTSKSDIQTLTEKLFTNDKNNAYKYITTNLQGKKMNESITDDATKPLFVVKDEAYEIPTIRSVLTLHNNYELDVKVEETVTDEKLEEEKNMINQFMATDVMNVTMKFLLKKGYVPDDKNQFKDRLKRIWFTQFKRTEGDAGSSGFESVFLAEKFNNETIGMHNWIYYAKQEAAKKLNYLGYIQEKKLGNNGAIFKVRSILDGAVQPVTTIFVGTSPELEMALYTVCFYTRPNYPCPVKLGGTEFVIIVNAFSYFKDDIIVSAYPEI